MSLFDIMMCGQGSEHETGLYDSIQGDFFFFLCYSDFVPMFLQSQVVMFSQQYAISSTLILSTP